MLVVGLTGGICSGKSTVARMFERRGAVVIDADRIAHQLQEPGQLVYEKIVQAFGLDILKEDGSIDRVKLGAQVFQDPEKRRLLEGIMHPAIVQACEARIQGAKAEGALVCLVDAALIIEAGRHERFQRLIVVAAPEALQLKRLMERDGLSHEEALARLRAQMPLQEKKRYAHYIIENAGPLEETERQVEEVWERLLAEAKEEDYKSC